MNILPALSMCGSNTNDNPFQIIYVVNNDMMMLQHKTKGVTLLEVLLVLAIAGSILVVVLNYITQKTDEIRRDKTVLQMQQILDAGLSFYTNNSFWPVNGATIVSPKCDTTTWSKLDVLQAQHYIPDTLYTNNYGNDFQVNCDSNTGAFFVATEVDTEANAAAIVGRLPMGARTTKAYMGGKLPPFLCKLGSDCTTVIANVNIPGQNLNNARSINFGALYYNGSCVPAPKCPPNMKPSILIMPAAIAGVNDLPTPACPTCGDNTYPLHSFTAFIRGGDAAGNPIAPSAGAPTDCQTGLTKISCLQDQSGTLIPDDGGTQYWRVCLAIVTEKGLVTPTGSATRVPQGKKSGSIIALTRCVPNNGNENPSGSIDVWQQY